MALVSTGRGQQTGWRNRRDLYGDEEAQAVIHDRYQPDNPLKRGLERQWTTNISFLAGYQYNRQNEIGQSLPPPSPTRFRARSQSNFIRPYHDRRVAYFSSFRPDYKVSPNSRDSDDQTAAETNESILKHYWRKLRMSTRMQDHAHWRGATGNAFFEVMWDTAAGEQFAIDMEDSAGQSKQTLISEGDLRIELHSPYEISVDPIAKHPEDLEWILISKVLPMQWAARHYPDRLEEIEEGSRGSYMADKFYERIVAGLIGPAGYYNTIDIGYLTREDWVLMHKCYERATPEHPNGRMIVTVNDVVVHNDRSPHPKAKIPVVWSRDMIVPGRIWGQSTLDNLIDPQRDYNRLKSGKMSHILSTCYAKVMWPVMAGNNDATFVTEWGEKIVYAGSQPPHYLEPPGLPRETEQELLNIKRDFDDISSSYATSRGQYQGKLSGTAMIQLIDQDLKSQEPTVEMVAEDLSMLGCHMLEYLQAYAGDERIIKIIGKNRLSESQTFRAQDIRDNTDVYIEIGSMMPKSKAMAIEELTAIGNLGIINPADPRDRTLIWEMLQHEVDEPLLQDKGIDRRGARIENHYLSMGMPIPPAQAYEDHDLHVKMHTDEMKQDFVRANPPIMELFKMHLQTHLDIVYPDQGRGLVAQTPGQPAQGEAGGSEGQEAQ